MGKALVRTSVSFIGRPPHCCRSALRQIMRPRPGGSEPLAITCSVQIVRVALSKRTRLPVRTFTATTLKRISPELMRSKSTSRSSVALRNLVSIDLLAVEEPKPRAGEDTGGVVRRSDRPVVQAHALV